MALICDTGALYGALDRSDRDHEACAELIAGEDGDIVVPGPVVVELDWLASSRLEPGAFLAFLSDVRDGAVRVAELVPTDYVRIGELMEVYSDEKVGFVDAAVLAIMERLGATRLATLDRKRFEAMRPRHVRSLELLP